MLKISVLTPTFNAERFVERAINNVQARAYSFTEHIVMDGASTARTIEIVERYPHVIWKSEKDKEQSDAMNKAFELSTGDIIVYLNADDYFEEGIFEKVAEEFSRHNDIDILVGNGMHITPEGRTGMWLSEASYGRYLKFYKYQFP